MLINKKKIEQLNSINSTKCLSIYIKTNRTSNSDTDRIRWKNACSASAKQLNDFFTDEREVRKFLRPATDLLDDENFWLHLSDGLCMFITEDFAEKFILPIQFNNKIHLGNQFLLSPLLPFFKNRERFFLLDLSMNHIRFFECNKHHITPIIISDLVPIGGIEDTNILDDLNPNLQSHGNGIYHGHGKGNDAKDVNMEKYLREIDNGLSEIFAEENAPLILSGDISIVTTYKGITKYNNVVEAYVKGNNEHLTPIDLHEMAYKTLKKGYLPSDLAILSEYYDVAHTEKAFKGVLNLKKSVLQKKLKHLFITDAFDAPENKAFIELDNLIMQAFELGVDIDFFDSDNVDEKDEVVFGINHY